MKSLDLKRVLNLDFYRNDPANRWSLSRLLLTPLAIILFVIGLQWLAVAVFAVSQLTDLIDGYVARRTPGRSESTKKFGEEFDTLCDKVSNAEALLFLLVSSLAQGYVWIFGLLMVILAHELINARFTVQGKRSGHELHVIFPGKVSMACKMVSLSFVLAGLADGGSWLLGVAAIFGVAALPFGVVASCDYYRQASTT